MRTRQTKLPGISKPPGIAKNYLDELCLDHPSRWGLSLMSRRTETPEDPLRKDDTLHHSTHSLWSQDNYRRIWVPNHECLVPLDTSHEVAWYAWKQDSTAPAGTHSPRSARGGEDMWAETRGPLSHSTESQGWDSVPQAAPNFFSVHRALHQTAEEPSKLLSTPKGRHPYLVSWQTPWALFSDENLSVAQSLMGSRASEGCEETAQQGLGRDVCTQKLPLTETLTHKVSLHTLP